jgi:hypothetical protein
VIPRRQALALVAAGSRYITNFDAASARQAAPGGGQVRKREKLADPLCG